VENGQPQASPSAGSTAASLAAMPSLPVMHNLQCSCCECRGIKCLVGHPGHSCNQPGFTRHPWRR
jgi:hypothetical protein